MFRTRILIPCLTVLVFACTALAAEAQTGPIKGPGKGPAGDTKLLTAEKAAELLKGQVRVAPNGDKIVDATVEKDGWKFGISIAFSADGKLFHLVTALSGPNASFTDAQVQGQKKLNETWKADQKAFFINPQDNRLYLADYNFNTTASDQQFAGFVSSFLATIRNSHDVWKANN